SASITNGSRVSSSFRTLAEAKQEWNRLSSEALRKTAEAGNPEAQHFFGLREWAAAYEDMDRGSDSERAAERGRKGFEWMKRAAEQSLPYAEHAVAMRYLGDVGWLIVPMDRTEGLKWLQRAADHGSEAAQHKLADIYLLGGLFRPT